MNMKRFEEFTAQWQADHRGKYPSAFDYFDAIWRAAQAEIRGDNQMTKSKSPFLMFSNNPTNIERLLYAANLATVLLAEIDSAGARHINGLLVDALSPWKSEGKAK
jgi:hypothetical protein